MTTVNNLDNRSEYYASDDLINELRGKIQPNDVIVNFAYTDYGGQFIDKVMIAYFSENHPESIVKENTYHFGENAFIFGQVAADYLEANEDYPLGYEDTEEYYMNAESNQEAEDFARFLEDIQKYSGYSVKENALDYLTEHKGGYYSITTQGVDYSESDLIQFCEEAGIIEKIKEEA
jgi:hypothetical protein